MSEAEAAKKIESNLTQSLPDFVPSAELVQLMERLTSKQQRETLHRVAEAHLSSVRGSIGALFEGDGKVCSHETYYKKPTGWHHKPAYRAALDLYIRELRPFYLRDARKRAGDIIEAGAIAAAQKVMDLIESADDNVAYRAAKDALDRLGIGTEHAEQSDRVTVIINDSEWRPN
jgi:hypothetical protein